jgi:hypothetical protein
MQQNIQSRHSREGGNPVFLQVRMNWMPAYAGMTELAKPN